MRVDPLVEQPAFPGGAGALVVTVAHAGAEEICEIVGLGLVPVGTIRGREAGRPAAAIAADLRVGCGEGGRKWGSVHFVHFVEEGVRILGIDPGERGAEVVLPAGPERL
ncbi:hypothetical protein OMW55_01735 [Sphingomonas sp. BN140010]|uniref:Uncharacterized protein n=1 Tax=Sphingomonas arvum TaxID=2992113 RepID=A0ABT3JBT2_9SPHN|nr:hypothetical protein [Sphingomonas sp. BN140010]MCW3796530.1 hypothetical protein [Sphingomonas sp. BN140010]